MSIVVYVQRVFHNSSLYPLGTFWLIAMAIVPSAMAGWIDLPHALVFLAITALMLLLITDRRDTQLKRDNDLKAGADLSSQVEVVHELVNSNNSRMERRIDQLTKALQDRGIKVPEQPPKEDDGS